MVQRRDTQGGRSTESADTPYCTFSDDRERRAALVSRDVRLVLCRLCTVSGIVAVAVHVPGAAGLLARLAAMLGRLG